MKTSGLFKQAIEGATFSFEPRPEPIAGDLRMSWGIGILLLMLLHCHAKKGSFQKLQFLAHAIRTPEGQEDVRNLVDGRLRANEVSARIEPWLNRAVSYAHGLGLVEVIKGKSIALTKNGQTLAKKIDLDKDIFCEEREFLADVSRKLTEVNIAKIWKMEDIR